MQPDRRSRRIVSVILAAGRGTRMGGSALPKAGLPVQGVPAIVRAMEGYWNCGIQTHYVVVGAQAEQMIRIASAAPGNHCFCYQSEQRGTGHAARVAASLLESLEYRDDVLIVPGDKVIEEAFIRRLIQTYYAARCDVAFAVGEVDDYPTAGRVVFDDEGKPLGIVEVFDIARMKILNELRQRLVQGPMDPEEAINVATAHLPVQEKAARALGPLWGRLLAGQPLTRQTLDTCFKKRDFRLHIGGESVSPERLSGPLRANLALYLFRAPALFSALKALKADNAQQEEYLTDAIGALVEAGADVRVVPTANPEEVMAFNTAEELETIRQHYSARARAQIREESRTRMRASKWQELFASRDAEAMRWLKETYGDESPNVEDRRQRIMSLVDAYGKRHGDDEVVISRAPGRVNIMGRHVDHQGGHTNMIAIDRDIMMVVGACTDREVRLENLDSEQFPDRTLRCDNLLNGYSGNWRTFVDSPKVRDQNGLQGDWVQYIKASIARLQARFPAHPLKGMNVVVGGNIPVAAGLSSSSALVVGMMEAMLTLNELSLNQENFVDLCGEGEWYVGTRGGSGDHSAMKFARKGHVVQIRFFPLAPADTVPLPDDLVFLICNSHQKARKTAGARDVFNHRVACYHLGREFLKQAHPDHAIAIEHLRDVHAANLGLSQAEIFEMVRSLPTTVTRADILDALPHAVAAPLLSTHSDRLGIYPLRSVVLFGLAECARSQGCAELLHRGDAETFGKWINCSHNGDRVVKWHGDRGEPFAMDYSDAMMSDLAAGARRDDPESQMVYQPGAYGCSTPEIDRMVDIALQVNGVLGAQILGAGLGGCMMALVRTEACDTLRAALTRRYYEPAGLEPDVFVCCPVAGSGVVRG